MKKVYTNKNSGVQNRSYLLKIWITAFLIFIFALSLRLWNLNMMGRWWDDQGYLAKSYWIMQLIEKGDFNNPFWYTDAADHPPLVTYFYGLAEKGDFLKFDPRATTTFPNQYEKGDPIFRYDPVNTRMVSVVVSSLSVVLVFLLGTIFFSYFVGITAAVMLAMVPHFLGYSQMIDLESFIMLFFTACAFVYYLYLKSNKKVFLILTGILTGLNLEIKQSDFLIFVLYFATYFTWKRITKNKNITIKHYIPIILITLLTCFVVYPMPWFHPLQYFEYNYNAWIKGGGLIPEVIFGRMMGAHFFYYILAFFITTPVILILLSFLGIKISLDRKKDWIYPALVIWFITPFLLTAFHERQHMVRYIIQFYAPFSLLAAIGLEYIIFRFTKKPLLKYLSVVPIFIYLMYILVSISPFYYNYFNELVGGTKNVYEKKWFYLGYMGEGLRAPGVYIAEHASKNAKIGLATNPIHTLYEVPGLKYEKYNPKQKYDYVVVNFFNITRLGFNGSSLNKEYKLVYVEKAAGANLAEVYKHK